MSYADMYCDDEIARDDFELDRAEFYYDMAKEDALIESYEAEQ
jgi:hypothetical protein